MASNFEDHTNEIKALAEQGVKAASVFSFPLFSPYVSQKMVRKWQQASGDDSA